jgi:hypothetical protein
MRVTGAWVSNGNLNNWLRVSFDVSQAQKVSIFRRWELGIYLLFCSRKPGPSWVVSMMSIGGEETDELQT